MYGNISEIKKLRLQVSLNHYYYWLYDYTQPASIRKYDVDIPNRHKRVLTIPNSHKIYCQIAILYSLAWSNRLEWT